MSYIVRDLGGAGGASVMGKVGHGLGPPPPNRHKKSSLLNIVHVGKTAFTGTLPGIKIL